MGQGSLGEVESIVSPVAEAVAKELEPVQRGLTQAGAQVCSCTCALVVCGCIMGKFSCSSRNHTRSNGYADYAFPCAH